MKQIKYLILKIIIFVSFFACSAIFDNPVDPESDSYKGYKTVTNINDIKSMESAEYYTGGPELVVTKVKSASKYNWELSYNDTIFVTPLNYTTTDNLFNTNTIDLVKGRWYWRCKAIDSSGNSGVWTTARSFYLDDNIGNSYQIKYFSQDLDSSVPVDSNFYLEGSSIIVSDSGNMRRSRFKFNCWNTSPDGTGTSYQPGDIIIVGSENVILYAMWDFVVDQIPSYNLYREWLFNGTTKESKQGFFSTVNQASLDTDRFGNIDAAYKFDGLDDYILIDTNDLNYSSFSLSLWFKPNSSKSSLLEYISNRVDSYGFRISGSYSGLEVKQIDSSGIESNIITKNIELTNKWYHLTFTKDGNNNCKVYLDGVFVGKVSSKDFEYDINMNLNLGVHGITGLNKSTWFSGSIDDIRYYDEELSYIDIMELYHEKDNKAPKIAYVAFDKNAESFVSGSMGKQNFIAGVSDTLSKNNFSRSGYIFKGWSTTKNGDVEYLDSSVFIIGYEDVTLYAVWRISREGLVGEWLFNGNTNDTSGNGNHGVETNITYDSDNFGNSSGSLKLNGINSYVDVPVNGLATYTISLWVEKETAGIVFRGKNNEYASRIEVYNSVVGIRLSPSSWTYKSYSSSGNMQHYVFEVLADTQHVEIDSENGGVSTNFSGSLEYDTIYRIGGSDFVGRIDCLKVYNRELTEWEKDALTDEYEEYR